MHGPEDQTASNSSGSFRTNGMVITPCSAKTLAARMGVTLLSPMPAFYNRPASVDDDVDHIVARPCLMDQFGLDSDRAVRWEGPATARTSRPVPLSLADSASD